MLQLKLNEVSLSADGTILTVIDATGAYDSVTNPGGYGTPNRDVSTNIILRWKMFGSCDWVVIPGVTSGQLASGYQIDTTQLGLGTTPQLMPDGVEVIQYLGLYDKGNTVGVINGSKTVTLTPNFTSSDFTGIDYIAFGSDLTSVYKIANRNTTTLTLDRAYTGTLTTEEAYDAQNGDCYVLVQTYSNSQLDKAVAGTTEAQLFGKKLDKLFYRMMRLFIAQARFEQQDYAGANIIMQQLYTECFIKDFHDTY